MTIEIEDRGDKRVVTVEAEQVDGRAYHQCKLSTETALSRETLDELRKISSEQWLTYHLRRLDSDSDVTRQTTGCVKAFPPDTPTARFLDFGCGYGASALTLARLGYSVVGVDVEQDLLKLGRMMAGDYALDDLVTFQNTTNTYDLPFETAGFDAVLASGVFEHILPAERERFLTECWRVLKPGGVFYFVQSPNRLWPIESHTTNLPLVHWLPMCLAHLIIRRFCKGPQRNYGKDQLVAAGLVGVNLLALLRRLPGSEVCVLNGGNVPFYFSTIHDRKKGSCLRRVVYTLAYAWFRFLERPLRWVHVPVEAFLPHINVAIGKKQV